MGLLRTIVIIIGVYYGFKVLARLFAPFLLKFAVKKAGQKFGGFQNQAEHNSAQKQKEGETVIDKMPNQNRKSNDKVGEYVDYEEVE